MNKVFNQSLSFKVWLFIVVVMVTTFFFYQKTFRGKEFIVSDGYGYYIFLPATFIYHDLTFGYVNNLPDDLKKKCWIRGYPGESFQISKMTIGTAVLMMPFFLIAHGIAGIFHFPANGYSLPYQEMIAFAALFYFLAGLYFVRKSLLKFFSQGVTAVLLVLLTGATTVINYTLNDPSMSHIYSFFVFSLMVWYTIRWHETFLGRHFRWLCFCFGLIALIRLFNIVVCLFPILYGLQDTRIRNKKIKFVKEKWKTILTGALIFLIVLLPQVALWKYQTGRWIFDGYEGEHFFLNHPHIIDVLFGFRNGWLIYTPVMIISVIGMWIAVKQKINFGLPVVIFFPLMLYILSCWWCWNYGGAFGFRPFVDFYPIFILPAGTFITKVFSRKVSKVFIFVLLPLFIWLNLFQQFQYQRGILHYSDMTAKAYVAIFGRSTYPEGYDALIDPFDNEMAKLGKPLRNMRKFEDFGYIPAGESKIRIKASNGKYVFVDSGKNNLLVAGRDSSQNPETFTIIYLDKDKCALKSANGRFILSHESGYQQADMDIISENEIYDFAELGKNKFSLKSYNGNYLETDRVEPYYIIAKTTSLSDSKTFVMEK